MENREKKKWSGKKSKREKKEYRFTVRFTASERNKIRENCKLWDMSISDYVRNRCLGKAIDHKEITKKTNTLIYEINKIGNNINQLTKGANAGYFTWEEKEKLWNLMKDLNDKVTRTVNDIGDNEDASY